MPGPCSPIRNEEWLTLSLALRKEGLTLVRPHPGLESLGGGQAPAAKVNNHGSRVAGPLLPPRLFLSPVTLVAFSLMLSSSTWFFSIPGICRTGRVLSLSDLRLWMVRGGTRTAAPRWAAGQEALHRVRDPHPGGLSQLLRCTSWSPLPRSEHTSLLLCFWLHSRRPAMSSCPHPVFLSEDPVLPQLGPAHHPQAGGSPAAVLGVGGPPVSH